MRAYLIDTPNAQVIEVDYNGDWRTIDEHLQCDVFTIVVLNAEQDGAYVDDEGLINNNPHGWFMINDYGQPLRGYGLVLGADDAGASQEPHMSLEELRARISFPKSVDEAAIDRGFHITSF